MSAPDRRWHPASGDVLLTLSVLALAGALAYPQVRRWDLRSDVEQAVAAVQAVADATGEFRSGAGVWPDAPGPGQTPEGLDRYLPEGFSFDQDGYQLALHIWEAPGEGPPGAPIGSLAGVSVRSADPRVLAGLLDRFGADRSFLFDGTWTLVFASSPGR